MRSLLPSLLFAIVPLLALGCGGGDDAESSADSPAGESTSIADEPTSNEPAVNLDWADAKPLPNGQAAPRGTEWEGTGVEQASAEEEVDPWWSNPELSAKAAEIEKNLGVDEEPAVKEIPDE